MIREKSPAPIRRLLSRLEKVKETGRGQFLARCPAHDDRSPSLTVRETDDGRVLLHCFAGCPAADVLSAVGLTLADLFPEDDSRKRPLSRYQRRINPLDALAAIAHEAIVVTIIAADIKASKAIDDDTMKRLTQAASRIRQASEAAK